MEKELDAIKNVIEDKDLILHLLMLPDFNPKLFLFYWNWYNQREKQKLSRKQSVEQYCDIYILFPYSKELKAWFESPLSNQEIINFRGDGISLETAIQMRHNE